jgi:hypothetical protein
MSSPTSAASHLTSLRLRPRLTNCHFNWKHPHGPDDGLITEIPIGEITADWRIRAHGSNPAHGDVEAIEVATKSAEVFALPILGSR